MGYMAAALDGAAWSVYGNRSSLRFLEYAINKFNQRRTYELDCTAVDSTALDTLVNG